MKIEILRENLERAVSISSRVSNKNLSLPVLGCVVFVVEDGRALLRATNLDLSVEVVIKAKVLRQGVAAVPAAVLSQTVSALGDQKLTLEISGNSLLIEGERGKTSISTVDHAEFPTIPQVKVGKAGSASIPTRDFVVALRAAAFSSSLSSVKPELSSVAISLEKGELVAAATDSFRLAEVRLPVKSKSTFPTTLIPSRNVADIIRAIEGESEVEIKVDENQCSFVGEFGHITSRTIDGAFPDYHAVIPRDFVASATCLKDDAVRAFKKIAIFTDSFNHVHISLKPSQKEFFVKALNASVGETNDKIPAELEGEDIDINFNARYIMDALPVVGSDSVAFSVAGHGRPMVITDVPHKHFTYLVMPMNR